MTEPWNPPAANQPVETLRQRCGEISVATLSIAVLNKGFTHLFIKHLKPLDENNACFVGRAVTLRCVPRREDINAARTPRENPLWNAIESMQPGDVLVVEAGGSDGGILGDVLANRIHYRGGVGIVVDGTVRDSTGIRASGVPTFSKYVEGPAYQNDLTLLEMNVPVRVDNTTVLPGDYLVGDRDGIQVIPAEHFAEIVSQAWVKEQRDQFIVELVRNEGRSLWDSYGGGEKVDEEFRKARGIPPSPEK